MPISVEALMKHLELEIAKQHPPCPKCGCTRPLDDVHGHFQCANCKCVIDDCCQGEVADGTFDGVPVNCLLTEGKS